MSDALGRRTRVRRAENAGDRARRAELAAQVEKLNDDLRLYRSLLALMPFAVRVVRVPVRATGALQIPRQRRPSLDELLPSRRRTP